MNDVILYGGVAVITTRQLADAYGTTPRNVSNNFNGNKKRYAEGKHYFCLAGEELIQFKDLSRSLGQEIKAPKLYLWTERGALLLAKSINTDTAWDAYERLVDFYFDKKEPTAVAVSPDSQERHSRNGGLLPRRTSWYERNRYRIHRICKNTATSPKALYHKILSRLDAEYDLETANKVYEQETGEPPKYPMDVLDHFPELARLADIYLDGAELA